MKRAAFLFLPLLLSACVQTRSHMLDNSTATISARGGAVHTGSDVIAAVVRKAAQLTKEKGYRYFAVVSAENTTRQGMLYIPGQTHTYGTATAYSTGYGSAYGTYNSTSYTTPGTFAPITQPGEDVVIRMYHEGEIDPHAPGVYDAEAVLAQSD